MRFFLRNFVTPSASSNIAMPDVMIAIASTGKTSVMANAERIESKEKIRFISTISMTTWLADFPGLPSAS